MISLAIIYNIVDIETCQEAIAQISQQCHESSILQDLRTEAQA